MAGENGTYVTVGNSADNLAVISGVDGSVTGGQFIGAGEFIGGDLQSAITEIRYNYLGIVRNYTLTDGVMEVFAEAGHGLFVDASLAPLNYRALYSEGLDDVIHIPVGPTFHLSGQTDFIIGSRHNDEFLSGQSALSVGGEDSILGGGGGDEFLIHPGSQSSTLVIADFDADDRIVIKADGAAGVSPQVVDAFTGVAGQVKYSIVRGVATIEIDANGDAATDNIVSFAVNQEFLRFYTIGSGTDLYVDYRKYVDTLDASDGDNIVDGYFTDINAFNIRGYAGNDRLFGTQGANLIDGGSGADYMVGGDGDDIYIVDQIDDVVVESQDQGLDQVSSSVSYSLADHIENLTLIGALDIDGAGNRAANDIRGNVGDNVLYGDAGDDHLYGNAGVDLLNGGTGADWMEGGQGNDRYIVDNVGDTVVERAGEGFDMIDTSISYTLSTNVEALRLMGIQGAVDAHGNAGNNFLNAVWVDVAPAAGTQIRLYGEGGDDNLLGSRYGDLLDGGTGADKMTGGNGNDTYVVDNAGDVAIEQAGQGFDTVDTSVSYTLGANVEALRLMGIQGAVDAHGNAGNNWLNAVWVNVAPAAGTQIRLYGEGGNDDLQGSRYGDLLDGGTGADRMTGGLGNDSYVVDNAGDIVVEQAGAGYDVVTSSIGYALGDNVEAVRLIGVAAGATVVAQGNDLNNELNAVWVDQSAKVSLLGGGGNDRLLGSRYDDLLDGGTGADTMRGGRGNDSYVVDSVTDLVYEQAGEGYDVITSSVGYRLGANVEGLRLVGVAEGASVVAQGNDLNNSLNAVWVDKSASISLLGHGGDDTLQGSRFGDLLDGGAGSDRLTGGGGADRFHFGDVLNAATNVDTILDFQKGVDVIELDDAVFAGLNLGKLDASAFVANASGTATSADQRIIYDTDSGQLFYDADGSLGGAAVLFGMVAGHPPLTGADFVVV
ncbi:MULTISPECIES: calcium-binding protein [Sphingobium]|jgi:Ca2+-binding RTX toxin-like protein|uniref:calcium-binding protein n=2 Tax=Sphingomonadaceae TaxID=41297 RepID=UPI000EEC726F|nr:MULTISPECIES: calcium-binding protein [Sphingobium]MCC4258885.1 calcium-binding protein [Sphingobium lactosutens]HCW61161.1 hypothetical protein [Sphingobium sp.]